MFEKQMFKVECLKANIEKGCLTRVYLSKLLMLQKTGKKHRQSRRQAEQETDGARDRQSRRQSKRQRQRQRQTKQETEKPAHNRSPLTSGRNDLWFFDEWMVSYWCSFDA